MADHELKYANATENTSGQYGNLNKAFFVLKGVHLKVGETYALGDLPPGTIYSQIQDFSKNRVGGIEFDLGLEQSGQYSDYTIPVEPQKFGAGIAQEATGSPYRVIWQGYEYTGRPVDQGGEADYPVPMQLLVTPTAVGDPDDCLILMVEYVCHRDY